jgi:hypothetical protein
MAAIGRAEQPSSGFVGGYIGQAFGERRFGDIVYVPMVPSSAFETAPK